MTNRCPNCGSTDYEKVDGAERLIVGNSYQCAECKKYAPREMWASHD